MAFSKTATHCLSERRGQVQPQHSSRTPALPSGQGKTCRSMGRLCHGSNQACPRHAQFCRPRICQKSSNHPVSPGCALLDLGPWCRESQGRCYHSKNPGSCSSPQLEPRLAQQLVQGLEPVGRNSCIPSLKKCLSFSPICKLMCLIFWKLRQGCLSRVVTLQHMNCPTVATRSRVTNDSRSIVDNRFGYILIRNSFLPL